MTFNLRLIPLLPFLGAAILMLFGRKWSRDTVVAVAAGAIAGSCLVALDAFFTALPLAAPTGGLRDNGIGPKDFTIAFSFSLKAMPHGRLGSDTAQLLGGTRGAMREKNSQRRGEPRQLLTPVADQRGRHDQQTGRALLESGLSLL